MSILKEFRDFAARGNVVDLAVGVVIGGAFGKVVSSFVDDVLMPPIGLALGKVDFNNLYLPLDSKVAAGLSLADAKKAGPVLAYGSFLNSIVQFAIVAFAIFLVVKAVNRLRGPEPEAAPAGPSDEVVLLTEIRDALRK
ncbi:MAG: large conductance mechanosensitive channel protein MscL [Fimbriimonadaceae bacterium]|nr:large conductance mechanosensitive channel protein MscL [Fimbriimonadaceae bacterium]